MKKLFMLLRNLVDMNPKLTGKLGQGLSALQASSATLALKTPSWTLRGVFRTIRPPCQYARLSCIVSLCPVFGVDNISYNL